MNGHTANQKDHFTGDGRVLTKGATVKTLKALLLKAQSYQCAYCKCDLTLKEATFDHVVPRSKGGPNVANRVIACHACNNAKGNRMPTGEELVILKAAQAEMRFRSLPKSVRRKQKKRRRIWKHAKCWDDGEPC